ncbi:MAG: 4-alpha-glucanotransferase [Melioribacteraceae bacterium]|nr:4-alpha-glucanotransferase [Melioribacteraceae bacterium]
MKFKRSAGTLLHPTSLPGKYGIGDLGHEAYNFINFLESAGQNLWQVFPLGPTGYGDSPYQCFSAFAGNPLLISPDLLAEEDLLSLADLNSAPRGNAHNIDYGAVINYKNDLLKKAFSNFKAQGKKISEDFYNKNKYWLEDYSIFMAVKQHHGGCLWTEWSEDIAFREEGAVAKWKEKLSNDVEFQLFLQDTFNKQWSNIKQYANSKGIEVVGDLPIFIAYDSSDLWANRSLFTVDKKGKLETVAGVPPDYFSPTGQLWGNPLYRWDVMEKDDFAWWKKRFTKMFELVDIVRIDHFRGFDAFWEIPGDALTAQTGKWIKAPGEKLFQSINEHLGNVPIIAEDLGIITKEVTALREKFNFPGMRIIQFAFGSEGEKRFLPHNFETNTVVYSGSHDNDTTRGFFDKERESNSEVYQHAQKYLDYYGNDLCSEVIKAAYSSVADIVIIPMQDMLSLGSDARMNFPGKLGGNWGWRFTWEQVYEGLAFKYKTMSELFDRPPKEEEIAEIEVEDK